MKNLGWESNWDQTGDATLDPADAATMPIQPDEADTALALMAQARFMALNRERGDGSQYVVFDEKEYTHPEDSRPVDPGHSVAWLQIEHRGTYWEVRYGSQEFSSSFSATGRGITLNDAFEDALKRG